MGEFQQRQTRPVATKILDPWVTLGVTPGSSEEEVKSAFEHKEKTEHPDVSDKPNAKERWRDVSEAYRILLDPAFRKRYRQMEDSRRAQEKLYNSLHRMTDEQKDFIREIAGQPPRSTTTPRRSRRRRRIWKNP